MMNNKVSKLENPERLKELNPPETLKRLGLGEHDVVCDIGAGTGIFTIPAARITDNWVFALETDEKMLDFINHKAENEKLSNIKSVKVTGDNFEVADNIIDLAILVNVLHEIDNKQALLKEINRMLTSNGRLAIIEFYKQQTPMGPPLGIRISQEEIVILSGRCGFKRSDEFGLGDNCYCIVVQPE